MSGAHDFKGKAKCPNCPDRGWYYVGIGVEPEQCEWCWTNPYSNFHLKKEAERLAGFDDWWHNVGSAISPNDGYEDVSQFAERVCKEAWKAAKIK